MIIKGAWGYVCHFKAAIIGFCWLGELDSKRRTSEVQQNPGMT